MWKTILDLFFPINCLGCGQEGQFICPACFERMPLLKKPLLRFHQSSALTGLIIASDYNHTLVKQAIHRYKYDFVKGLAKPLGELMARKLSIILKQIHKEPRNDILLIPVPLHKKRLRWRGFNQAELLAQKISQELKIPLADNILIRRKYSLPQVNIKTSLERQQNIKQAFELNPRPGLKSRKGLTSKVGTLKRSRLRGRTSKSQTLKNKTIILIDDVCTTGATLEECAQALKPLQPKQILGLVAARG